MLLRLTKIQFPILNVYSLVVIPKEQKPIAIDHDNKRLRFDSDRETLEVLTWNRH